MTTEPLRIAEVFGLSPLSRAVRQIHRGLSGSPYEPATRWDLTSARIFKPRIGLPAWLGMSRADRRVAVYNLFNRVPQPDDEGYSVRVTYARDFRGGRHTYDGHLGTDFACPVGTVLVAAAPGVVARIGFEFDRGGLKIAVDHGEGLLTTYGHCARALVHEGRVVRRGEPIALSGAAGMELLLLFPWVAPHVHMNTWLNGIPVDPYSAGPAEVSLWRRHNDPVPHRHGVTEPDDEFEPSRYDRDAVEAAIDACRDPAWRDQMRRSIRVDTRAVEVVLQQNYRSAMFGERVCVYAENGGRRPVLDLPFRAEDYAGAWLPADGTG